MAKKKAAKITSIIVDLVEERNQMFNRMVSNQDKISNYKKLAKQYETKNKDIAKFINSTDRRILTEAGLNPAKKMED